MKKNKSKQEKSNLHPRNRNRERYDLEALVTATPELKNFIVPNKKGQHSINFSKPKAVKLLNKAILNYYYDIKNWDFPDENLCPPIPGRADYIHHVADLLAGKNLGEIPNGDKIKCLDIGVGASCIYPIIGVTEYQWKFIGSDIDPNSIASANKIINANTSLKNNIECQLQTNSEHFFHNILSKEDKIDVVICNPPFHSSIEDAEKGTRRKIRNLSGKNPANPKRNFAGNGNELVYEGGEYTFVQNMIKESQQFSKNCFWFTALISKKQHLKGLNRVIDDVAAYEAQIIPMGTSNKTSRILAWSFLTSEEQEKWRQTRWTS